MWKKIAILAVLLPSLTLAGTIARSTKPGGVTNFCDSYSLGNTQDCADLDTDLNTVYTLVNGALDDTNLAAGSVTASEIATGACTTDEILDGTITNTDVSASAAIAGTKLAVGASLLNRVSVAPVAGRNITTEDTVATLPAITTRGGPVLLTGAMGWYFDSPGAGIDESALTVRIKRDGVTIHTIETNPADSAAGGARSWLPTPTYIDTPGAGTFVYSITAQTTFSGYHVRTRAANTGVLYAIELP